MFHSRVLVLYTMAVLNVVVVQEAGVSNVATREASCCH